MRTNLKIIVQNNRTKPNETQLKAKENNMDKIV